MPLKDLHHCAFALHTSRGCIVNPDEYNCSLPEHAFSAVCSCRSWAWHARLISMLNCRREGRRLD